MTDEERAEKAEARVKELEEALWEFWDIAEPHVVKPDTVGSALYRLMAHLDLESRPKEYDASDWAVPTTDYIPVALAGVKDADWTLSDEDWKPPPGPRMFTMSLEDASRLRESLMGDVHEGNREAVNAVIRRLDMFVTKAWDDGF